MGGEDVQSPQASASVDMNRAVGLLATLATSAYALSTPPTLVSSASRLGAPISMAVTRPPTPGGEPSRPRRPARAAGKPAMRSRSYRDGLPSTSAHAEPPNSRSDAPVANVAAAMRMPIPNGKYPALVLNADYTPLSHVPLSLWSWKDSVRAVFRDAVIVIASYNQTIRSPSVEINLPSIVVLKEYQSTNRGSRTPVLTRRNVFLRDEFSCQYCRCKLLPTELTYDHVVPQSKGGPTTWENVVAACSKCNVRKGSKLLSQLPKEMKLKRMPYVPAWEELQAKARKFPPKIVHSDWVDFVGVPGQEHGRATDDEQLDLDLGNDWGI